MDNKVFQKWNKEINEFLSHSKTNILPRTYYEEKAKEIINYVGKYSKFYKDLFLEKCDNDSIFPFLKNIPFTTKADLQRVGRDVCSMNFDKIATYYETTGTTGKPTPCPRSSLDIETSGKFVEHALKKAYLNTFGNMEALTAIMGPSELYAFGDTYGEICRNLGIPFVRLWPESPRVGVEKAAQLIKDLNVKSMICSPAIALALARYYKSLNIEPSRLPIKQIFVLGELCTPEMLKNISNIWDAKCTHGLYGSQEIHALATGTIDGELLISETNYIVEIIPLANWSKEIGELCVTMLVPGAKPLIRFKTGDLAYINNENNPRTLKILGRVKDIIIIDNKEISPFFIESSILSEFKTIFGYQCTIWLNEKSEENMSINVVADVTESEIQNIEKNLKKKFNIDVYITTKDKLDPKTETGAYVSWKSARIIDRR
ncbi:phenylacetate--CoA ligase family protein [Staphylococcus epidermidis]|uniref:phenylacetate--CoA ligase family protein n=2 Tax=Bacillati TaxID=1783272 RepID=UPI00195C807E|nr:phenylacetate--CoA ligase family protein [Staphylococcus epidermidis]MBM6078044.1 phenylacetate--CoA ligase family protein [Staphylococcus epidermidis]MBM6082617.1 phenylacetate--CoA ligase family protein [Staphylococcus epidermidis]MEB6727283.1 phenylacetate--CoA ligase family protein [Staphylococcus epidermidis]QRT38555.1 phenylacetate--CoA ligase family protein [Staphylococcus epidermidis]